MRILLITDKFLPERGGSQQFLAKAYQYLEGHEVTVLTRTSPGDVEADRSYPHRVMRVPYSRIPRLRSPLLWLRLAREARKLTAGEHYDQIHCGQTVETAPWGVRLAHRLQVPSLVHTFAEDVTTYIPHPFYGPLMRRALGEATVVSTISAFTLDHLLGLGVPEDRITLIYPGVSTAGWGEPDPGPVFRRLGLDGKRVILTVSRLIPRKGHDVVLTSLPEVLKRAPDAAYLIVGTGPEEARLKALACELGVEKQVIFAGGLSNEEAAACYCGSQLFVMPNRMMPNGDVEGFGLVFLEANAWGLPVIGGRSGGAVDAISDGETGFLVDPESMTEVGERILKLLQDGELRARMGDAGRERVRRDFTWRHTGEGLAKAVRQAQHHFGTAMVGGVRG
jgi:phosphatidyl-myo-inositol dimannoside synthase